MIHIAILLYAQLVCVCRAWQYHKSNSALDLMIGELRLKVDGMQKELHTQNTRLEEGARFAEHFHNDLRVAVQVCCSQVPYYYTRLRVLLLSTLEQQ